MTFSARCQEKPTSQRSTIGANSFIDGACREGLTYRQVFDVRVVVLLWGIGLMAEASLTGDVYGFAIELRKLAYTMPSGHEDPLIRLSERMVRYAQQQVQRDSSSRQMAN